MDIVTIIIGLFLTLSVLLMGFTSLPKRGKRLPPGPTPWPIIGSLHLIGNQPHDSLAKLAEKHGPIMSLKLGQITTIVVSSSDMAKEVLKTQDLAFSSRSISNSLHAHDYYKYSMGLLPVGPKWRSLRKVMSANIFSVKSLDGNEHVRREKVKELIAYCRKNSENGVAIDVGKAAYTTTSNLLSNIIFSKDVTDSAKELMANIMMYISKPNLVDFYPILAKIDPQGIRRQMTIHVGKMLELINGLIDERSRPGASQRADSDFLDVLLNISQETPDEIDRKQIPYLIMGMFVAGPDTISTTLEWAMTEMIKNPYKMKKVQDEIAQVIGKGKVIHDADVARLPYLRCVVKESLRMHPPAPFLMPRQVDKDAEVCGYMVPKGSRMLVNAWAISRDESIWNDAHTFNPERFLESEIDIHGQDFELIPFGAGRRICPGLPMATRMVYVMLGSLLNCFNWQLDGRNGKISLDMTDKFGHTLQKAHPLLVVPTLI